MTSRARRGLPLGAGRLPLRAHRGGSRRFRTRRLVGYFSAGDFAEHEKEFIEALPVPAGRCMVRIGRTTKKVVQGDWFNFR